MLNIEQKNVEESQTGDQSQPRIHSDKTSPVAKGMHSHILRYGLAIIACAITILVSNLLTYYSIHLNLTALVFVAIVVSAWYGGRGPGILAVFIYEISTIITKPMSSASDVSIGQFLFGHFSVTAVLVCLVLLVTSRRIAEKRIRDSEERYRHLFENNPFPMWVYDAVTYKFLAVNDAAVFYYGYSREEFLTMNIKDIRPPDQVSQFLKHISKNDQKLNKTDVWQHRKKDGSIIDVEVSSHELVFDGKFSRLVLANDITKRKAAEDAIRQLNETLELRVTERTSELEAANKEMEAFSYSVSHDLRAPLRAIDGFSRIFIEDYADQLDDEARRVLNVIRSNAKNMGQLIDDLLAFSRLGRKHIEPSVVNMSQLAEDVCLQIESNLLQTQNLKIQLLPEINGDRALLRQVFINLVSNAVKYSKPKENVLIEVGGETGSGENIYYIRDNGVGFDMKYAGKLFGVFQRLHSAEEFEGTGVGLAIVDRIVQRHGGRVWAESEVNKGSTFYFALPQNNLNQMEQNNEYQ